MATNGWTWRQRATWVLLSLLACTGLGGLPVSAQRPATGQLKVFERSFEAGLGRTIQVENTSGTTKVEVWGEDLIHIMAARPDGRWVDERDIKIVATPSQFTVRCIPKMGGINLKLYIPAESHVRLLSHSGTIELIGPVASATVETDSGDVAVEVPRWFDADVELHSANGTATSHLSLARYEEKSSRAIKGRLGRGGRAIIVRSAAGHVALKSLRSSVAIVEPASTPSVAVADDAIPSQPTRFPPPDERPSDRPLTPIFGGGTQSQDDSSATYGGVGGIGRQQRRFGDDTTMSGGIGVRIIPPPGAAARLRTPLRECAVCHRPAATTAEAPETCRTAMPDSSRRLTRHWPTCHAATPCAPRRTAARHSAAVPWIFRWMKPTRRALMRTPSVSMPGWSTSTSLPPPRTGGPSPT
ncbi:hypothetical protein [Chloracidobacterium aggregatum]|uniref:hypothetical protein n=1 Tax=Chloracidobacterium aggregatum TaxID=2851959 RepID=UPI001B8D4BD8|nr:hypothetical protein [Chloracidobacterium aggregatum]QUV96248.1 hypothetical protein J8C00_07930 [Chloracidobacterium sp. E]